MSMSDPVADMLTRIRNAILRKHDNVQIPFSNLKENILKVLVEEGFVSSFTKEDGQSFSSLNVTLKYVSGSSVIRKLERISKPGLRKYNGYKELSPVLSGQGVHIVSTSKGVLTDQGCRDRQVGGEILCTVY